MGTFQVLGPDLGPQQETNYSEQEVGGTPLHPQVGAINPQHDAPCAGDLMVAGAVT